MLTWRILILEVPVSNLSHNTSYYKGFLKLGFPSDLLWKFRDVVMSLIMHGALTPLLVSLQDVIII